VNPADAFATMERSHSSQPGPLSLPLIQAAHGRIHDKVHRTPVMTSGTLDALASAHLYFKCENLQKGGVFKARGATNAVLSLTAQEAARGVVTHSSGNHAAALARAARLRAIPVYIVMPQNVPKAKVAAVRRYGGEIVFCEPTLEARETTARRVIERTGAWPPWATRLLPKFSATSIPS
jgi:threonine dehydratase